MDRRICTRRHLASRIRLVHRSVWATSLAQLHHQVLQPHAAETLHIGVHAAAVTRLKAALACRAIDESNAGRAQYVRACCRAARQGSPPPWHELSRRLRQLGHISPRNSRQWLLMCRPHALSGRSLRPGRRCTGSRSKPWRSNVSVPQRRHRQPASRFRSRSATWQRICAEHRDGLVASFEQAHLLVVSAGRAAATAPREGSSTATGRARAVRSSCFQRANMRGSPGTAQASSLHTRASLLATLPLSNTARQRCSMHTAWDISGRQQAAAAPTGQTPLLGF